jgi:hypothetical protein
MQIIHPHKSIVNLYCLVAPEKNAEYNRRLALVNKWEDPKEENVLTPCLQRHSGISRATYYRFKKFLKTGIILSKRPKTIKKSRFGPDVKSLIFKIRKENPTYGKFKIAVISILFNHSESEFFARDTERRSGVYLDVHEFEHRSDVPKSWV